MKKVSLFLAAAFFIGISSLLAQQDTGRKVAITIDDLPTVSLLNSPDQKQEITRKIVKSLSDKKVPAIGFVNEIKLYAGDTINQFQVGLLHLWLEAALELGNHSYSHPSFHQTDTSTFFQDVLKGQQITNSLLSATNGKVKYFRHPYLHTGNSIEKKRALEKFLKQNNLTAAPVTVDNSDWIYARAYDNALLAGDSVLMKEIGESYIEYMKKYFTYYENQSVQLLGYEIAQTLLLHANTINADYLDELLNMLVSKEYSFVSLDEALQDEAYGQPDNFTGEGGISWIHRWALSQGKDGSFFRGEPETPEFVVKTANLK